MKKIFAVVLSLMLVFTAALAAAETLRIGELKYLNSDDAARSDMVTKLETTLNQVGGSLFEAPGAVDRVEIISFDNLSSMQMALQSGQIDAMLLGVVTGDYLAQSTRAFSVFVRASEYQEAGGFYTVSDFSQPPEMIPDDLWYSLDQTLGTDFSFLMSEDHTALRDEFNRAISELKADGAFTRMLQEQFDAVAAGNALTAVEPETFDGAETIRVAVTGDLPPLDYVDESGRAAGFNTAVLSAIGKKLGKNIELVPIDSAARAMALSGGSVDVVFWCRCANPYDGMAEALKDVKPGVISMITQAAAALRDPTLDIPESTILTDPYWHDLMLPVYLIQ